MNDYTTPPRRPIPSPSGIAAKAIALRERVAQAKPGEAVRMSPEEFDQLRSEKTVTEMAPQGPTIREALFPFQGVGNLAKGIAGVMSEVGTIQKTGFNQFHNYKYATLQDLLYAITPLMGKHGVVVIQNEVERTSAENRIMVTYEFSIFHTSGEMWPERPRFTGMCIGRNSKGDYDDKAINKAHSAARKYFLLSLFQVPSGDFDDADAGPDQTKAQPAKQTTVPGPKPQNPPLTTEKLNNIPPQKIGLGAGAGAITWTRKYIECIKQAASEDDLAAWDELNAAVLHKLEADHPGLSDEINDAVTERTLQVAPQFAMERAGGGDFAQDAMQWVAQHLVNTETYEAAEKFWNEAVAIHEERFDPTDWELLMHEWRRVELRFNPDPEPEPPEAA